MNRREFIRSLVVTSALVATGAVGISELMAKLGSQQSAQVVLQQGGVSTTGTQTQQIQAPQGYVFVAPLTALSGKASVYFNHPIFGNSMLINVGGQWRAFSSTCTHQACTVQYGGGSSIDCPCHGATFSTSNGAVLGGPAPRPLPEYGVQVQNGNLFVSTSQIN